LLRRSEAPTGLLLVSLLCVLLAIEILTNGDIKLGATLEETKTVRPENTVQQTAQDTAGIAGGWARKIGLIAAVEGSVGAASLGCVRDSCKPTGGISRLSTGTVLRSGGGSEGKSQSIGDGEETHLDSCLLELVGLIEVD
jgi:hypothetical protein